MIKHLLVICLLTLAFISLKAQPYGNEWINYSQKYYKIKIAQNGVYRIDSITLAAAGIPNNIDPRNFQLFNKGVQQYIYVQGESDGVFNGSDYIEFYAQKNDGSLDSLLYKNTSFIPNPYYSLINDTAAYFLTWNSSISNNRMIPEIDTTFSSYTPDNYFFKEEVQSFHSNYFDGETNLVGGTDARYVRSEGWFDASVMNMGITNQYTNLLNTSNVYAFGPSAKIKTVVIGASKDQRLLQATPLPLPDHHLTINYKGSSGVYQQLTDTLFKGYESNRFIYTISASSLGTSYTDFKYTSVADPNFQSNRTTVSYIYIKYPHTFNLEGKNSFVIYLPQNSLQSKSYLDISNFSATDTVRLYDLSDRKRIVVIKSGSNYRALVPNSGKEKKCFITSDAFIYKATLIQPVTPSAQFTNYSTSVTDSAYVIVTHKLLMSSAIKYKNYRSSVAGGLYKVMLADIDELYDQFAYGIVKSPLSIRGFSDYLLDKYPTQAPPKNLFLMGKSIHMNQARINPINDPANYVNDLVPSFGNPSSDNLLTSGLNGTTFDPAIATGRLAAKNTGDIDLYLNKVQQYEDPTNVAAEWKKYVLHFGGGTNSGEQNTFKSYLNTYKAIIQDTLYGGTVIKEFFKNSSAPIQINASDTLRNLINNGISLMTFFGHASGTGFDQSIDDIGSYNPLPGHYPLVFANSCYAGDFHQPDQTASGSPLSSSEAFVLAANKGAIAYIGSTNLGVPYALNDFSKEFYTQLALRDYGKGIGSCIKKTIKAIQSLAFSDTLVRETCYEMSLHGDPALKINTHDKPDYKITNNDVRFDLTSKIDSFAISVTRTNIGKATGAIIFTEVLRTFPNGDTARYLIRNVAPKFKDTVTFKIPFNYSKDVGLNKIKVTLDSKNNVDELNENNNSTNPDVDLFINGGDIVPVYPYQFAIIPANTVTLKASTANMFAKSKNYIFQIDTTDRFNSPIMTKAIINAPGGVVQWLPPLTFTDSTVYYWRVSPDSINASSGYIWRESSFQYINTKHGWEQAHFFQFKNDGYQFVNFNRPQRKFDFVNDVKNIICKDGIYPYIPWTEDYYSINGEVKNLWSYTFPGFTFAVIDPVSGNPVLNIAQNGANGQYGSITTHPPGTAENEFEFYDNDSLNRSIMAAFITNPAVVKSGYYVLAYSQGYHNIQQYEPVLVNAFQTLGSPQIKNASAARPYILFGRKNMGNAREIIGDSVSSIIKLDTSITTNWHDGFIASPVIGPAQSWGSLHWRQTSVDGASTKDSIVVRVIGIDVNGKEVTLKNFPKDSIDVLDLANYVDAKVYPQIRLVAYMKDDSLNTPPQLKRWQVIYAPVPEAAINPPVGYAITSDTLQEGDNIKIRLPIQNISEYNFTDSLLVTYWVEDGSRVNHTLPYKLKKKPFVPGEIIIDTITVNTATYQGTNALWVEVNPVKQPKSQLEQYHFNNILRIPFYTTADHINPLLDVTFDGVHILNNDIVSAKPNILVKLKDENQFLALNDTNDFKIFIQTPSSSLAKRIYFGNEMSFIPAVLPNNSCKIDYTPVLTQDGTHQLIIQAKDKSNNQSGTLDYKINFEVINNASITEVMNYPNPFTTATHFVFTLTGSEVPTYFKIQILTITGKVVREITNDELGLIHIGRNITDYAWNGKDEFGDRLANGVYLYRVVTSLHGSSIDKRETEADQYFKKGFGKMYLMR